jgi:hypothetical protein
MAAFSKTARKRIPDSDIRKLRIPRYVSLFFTGLIHVSHSDDQLNYFAVIF